jgi:hypothetical protein
MENRQISQFQTFQKRVGFAITSMVTENYTRSGENHFMTMINIVDPQEWGTFLNGFNERNRGRRARFEIFSHGNSSEEQQEGHFEHISIDGHNVTIKRTYAEKGQQSIMNDELKNVRGISVQYDTDNSEDMLEFTDAEGNLTTLHFESHVDGDS